MNNIRVTADGTLEYKGIVYRCMVGKAGIVKDKTEGDGATPQGCFPIREVLYRADRVERPESPFITRQLTKLDAWCTDPKDVRYNSCITVTMGEGTLWREDNIFDVIVVLGYNDDSPIPGKGSGIFMHIARESYTPTDGCIALSLSDLRQVLANASADTQVCTV